MGSLAFPDTFRNCKFLIFYFHSLYIYGIVLDMNLHRLISVKLTSIDLFKFNEIQYMLI